MTNSSQILRHPTTPAGQTVASTLANTVEQLTQFVTWLIDDIRKYLLDIYKS